MSMIKIATAGEHWLSEEPAAQLVKMASSGLTGQDLKSFEKRASASLVDNLLRRGLREKVASDETLIHMLAIGATEDYGPNRNGDGFRREVCKLCHPTFVKHAKFYRNHKNKDPRKSYGRIVESMWNEPMKRIELLVALNSTKSAADRNGGLIADREMDKLSAGKDIPVSMACKIAHDVCSWCGNVAPTTEDYCDDIRTGGQCKAGGLKDNIGSIVTMDGDAHQLHADNPHPLYYFDMSHVVRPADRIAYVTGVLEKAAAARNGTVKSAELARQLGVTVPASVELSNLPPGDVADMVKLAYELADIEQSIARGVLPVANGFVPALRDPSYDEPMPVPKYAREKFAHVMRALSDNHICLPLHRFLELTLGQEKSAEISDIVARELPGLYTRLIDEGRLVERIKESGYAVATAECPTSLGLWARKLAADLSLASRFVSPRITRAALREDMDASLRQPIKVKTAAARSTAVELAEEYLLYKLAYLGSVPTDDPECPCITKLAVLQNYVPTVS